MASLKRVGITQIELWGKPHRVSPSPMTLTEEGWAELEPLAREDPSRFIRLLADMGFKVEPIKRVQEQ